MTSLTFVKQILPSEPLCSILSLHYSLILTIISLSCDTEPIKAATPGCEQMAEMNHSELAMWQANAQLAATR